MTACLRVQDFMLKRFYDETKELVALVVLSQFEKDGIAFFTPDDFLSFPDLRT
jgi:hypothetical protein